jgi:repressor LexA
MPSSRDRAGLPLGQRQAAVLGAIEAYVRRHDRPPTVREIGHDARIASTGHVAHVLAALERRGYLTCEHGVARGIHLTRTPGVPILGTIAAGVPLDLFDAGLPELLDLAAHVRDGAARARAGDGDAAGSEFALLVRGNSMIEDGILDGDYVLMQRAAAAPEGALVVAVHLTSAGASVALPHSSASIWTAGASACCCVRRMRRCSRSRSRLRSGRASGAYRGR